MVDIVFNLEITLKRDTIIVGTLKEKMILQEGPYDVMRDTLCQGLQVACDNMKKDLRILPPP
jgi:hypothetical protein